MPGFCSSPIKGVVLRVVLLDVCGNVVTGANARHIVTNLFTQVQMTPQYEAGTDFFERTADGGIGVNQVDPPILKRIQNQVDLMSIDPDMIANVLTCRELVTSAPVSGYGFGLSEGPSTNHFSLETWQRVAGAGACSAGGLQQYIYHAWPNCYNSQVLAYTISNARSTLSFQCDTSSSGTTNWGAGPGTTKYLPPTGTTTALPTEHWLYNLTTNAPPTAVCGYTLTS